MNDLVAKACKLACDYLCKQLLPHGSFEMNTKQQYSLLNHYNAVSVLNLAAKLYNIPEYAEAANQAMRWSKDFEFQTDSGCVVVFDNRILTCHTAARTIYALKHDEEQSLEWLQSVKQALQHNRISASLPSNEEDTNHPGLAMLCFIWAHKKTGDDSYKELISLCLPHVLRAINYKGVEPGCFALVGTEISLLRLHKMSRDTSHHSMTSFFAAKAQQMLVAAKKPDKNLMSVQLQFQLPTGAFVLSKKSQIPRLDYTIENIRAMIQYLHADSHDYIELLW